MKKKFYTELAYVCGVVFLALGTALMECANLGVSMVVAPSYLIYLKVSEYLPFFTFGMSEYIMQTLLLAATMIILRKFHISYLFTFVTIIVYSPVLDLAMKLVSGIPSDTVAAWILLFCAGTFICALGVAFMFNTYLAPGAYELFVKELAPHFGVEISRFKTWYDCISCLVGVVLSFVLFGFGVFRGVGIGTVVCSLVNGWLIGKLSAFLTKRYDFCDALPFGKYFD